MATKQVMGWILLWSLIGWLIPAQAQNQTEGEEDTGARSAFIISRKKVNVPVPKLPTKGKVVLPPAQLGLGYTLYARLRGENAGAPIRVDPSQIFHEGDALRFVLESNAAGFLYVFYVENNSEPVMLFPDMRLNGGNNRILAHVPYELPSSKELNPRFRWFYFGKQPATERLFFVVTRKALPGIPVGPELLAFCQQFPGGCPWKPPVSAWKQIQGYLSIPARMSKTKRFGDAQKNEELEAIDRSFGLTPDNPEPSIVRMNSYATSDILIARVDLIHE